MISGLSGAVKDLGLRFNLVSLLPTGTLVLFVLGLLASGAPANAPDVHRLADRVADLDAWQSSALFLATVAGAIVLQPLQLSLVRLLEGYWGESRAARALAWPGRELAKQRRRALERATKVVGRAPTPAEKDAMVAATSRLDRFFPPEQDLLPTRLGNVLRAAETRAGGRYGLLTVVAWPRLYPLLPERTAAIVDDQRDQLDVAARFCAVFVIGAVVALALLVTHGWWLFVPAAALLLAWISYRAAIAAALQYSVGLDVAFDLHRFELLRALHRDLPTNHRAEVAANTELSTFLLQGPAFAQLDYEGADVESERSAAAAVEPAAQATTRSISKTSA